MATPVVMKPGNQLGDNENQERIGLLLHKTQMQKLHKVSKFPNQIVSEQSLEFVYCYMAYYGNSHVLTGSTLSQSRHQHRM